MRQLLNRLFNRATKLSVSPSEDRSTTLGTSLHITSQLPGVLTEYRPPLEQVLPASSSVLLSLVCGGSRFSVTYQVANGSVGSVPGLRLASDEFQLDYELPEFGAKSNFRQLYQHPIYIALRGQLQGLSTSGAAHLTARSGPSGLPWWGTAALVVMTIIVSILMFAPQPIQVAQGPLPTQLTSGPTAEVLSSLSSGDQLNEIERQILGKTLGEGGIEWRKPKAGAVSFVVFSDPNCPACQALEKQLETLGPNLAPIIVPVAFRPGSDARVAQVLCANDVSAAWRQAVAYATLSPPCDKGRKLVANNNAAFVALKFNATPTIVAPNGKVAVGAKDFDAMIQWVRANSAPAS